MMCVFEPLLSVCVFVCVGDISIERALYSFECNFHTLFNYTQADCRLDYTRAENRSANSVLCLRCECIL